MAHRISCSFTISLLTTTRTRDRQPKSHVSRGTSSRPKWTRLSLCVQSCRSTAVWTTCPSSLQEWVAAPGQPGISRALPCFSQYSSSSRRAPFNLRPKPHPQVIALPQPPPPPPAEPHSHHGHCHGPPEVGQGALSPQGLGAMHVGDRNEDWRKWDQRGHQTCHGPRPGPRGTPPATTGPLPGALTSV